MSLLKTLFTLAVLTILLCFNKPAFAEPLSIGGDIPYSVLVDAKGELTFEQAEQTLRYDTSNQQMTLSRGYTRETFWLGFELTQKVFNQKERWLELGPNFVDDIQLFFREKGSDAPWQRRQTGDLFHSVSDLDYRNPVFVLPAPSASNEGYEVVMRVRSTSTVILAATVW